VLMALQLATTLPFTMNASLGIQDDAVVSIFVKAYELVGNAYDDYPFLFVIRFSHH